MELRAEDYISVRIHDLRKSYGCDAVGWRDMVCSILADAQFDPKEVESIEGLRNNVMSKLPSAILIEDEFVTQADFSFLVDLINRKVAVIVMCEKFGSLHQVLFQQKYYDWVTQSFSVEQFLGRLKRRLARVDTDNL